MPDLDTGYITSACYGARHWNCSGHLRYFFRPWKKRAECECLCHAEPSGWRDVAGAFAISADEGSDVGSGHS